MENPLFFNNSILPTIDSKNYFSLLYRILSFTAILFWKDQNLKYTCMCINVKGAYLGK